MTREGTEFWNKLRVRERRMLRAICMSGSSYRQIAGRLGNSEGVVKNYAHILLEKSGTVSRVGLTIFCYLHGIVPCPCGNRRQTR